jgi:hypothetical protein
MSFIKKSQKGSNCKCQAQPASGTFRLSVVPIATDVRERETHDESVQLANAERIQDMFLPSMLKAGAHSHGNGYHVHPDQPRSVAHIAQLHDVLDDHNLAVRIGLAPGGDGKAVTASLDRAHVAELVENNIVDVSVPLDGGTFRLHSNAPGRITAVEYVA